MKKQGKINKFFGKILNKITHYVFELAYRLPPKSTPYHDEEQKIDYIDYDEEAVEKSFWKRKTYDLANYLWDIEIDYFHLWDEMLEDIENEIENEKIFHTYSKVIDDWLKIEKEDDGNYTATCENISGRSASGSTLREAVDGYEGAK